MKQVDIWQDSEGDAWHRRCKSELTPGGDRVLEQLAHFKDKLPVFKSILEIGCGTGSRLRTLADLYHCDACGVDASADAVRQAGFLPGADIYFGRADNLEFVDNIFDLVIFGFVLYACDPDSLFRIVTEADRVLRDGGILVIHDFHAIHPHSRPYAHDKRLRTYKMGFANLFTAHPFYSIVSQRIYGTETNYPITPDDAVSVTILRKNIKDAFPFKEWDA